MSVQLRFPEDQQVILEKVKSYIVSSGHIKNGRQYVMQGDMLRFIRSLHIVGIEQFPLRTIAQASNGEIANVFNRVELTKSYNPFAKPQSNFAKPQRDRQIVKQFPQKQSNQRPPKLTVVSNNSFDQVPPMKTQQVITVVPGNQVEANVRKNRAVIMENVDAGNQFESKKRKIDDDNEQMFDDQYEQEQQQDFGNQGGKRSRYQENGSMEIQQGYMEGNKAEREHRWEMEECIAKFLEQEQDGSRSVGAVMDFAYNQMSDGDDLNVYVMLRRSPRFEVNSHYVKLRFGVHKKFLRYKKERENKAARQEMDLGQPMQKQDQNTSFGGAPMQGIQDEDKSQGVLDDNLTITIPQLAETRNQNQDTLSHNTEDSNEQVEGVGDEESLADVDGQQQQQQRGPSTRVSRPRRSRTRRSRKSSWRKYESSVKFISETPCINPPADQYNPYEDE